MAALMTAAFVAPATILLVKTPQDTIAPRSSPHFGFWDRHVSLHLGGGAGGVTERADGRERDVWGGALVGSLEYLRNGIYAEVKVEDSHVRPHRRFQTARIGLLKHAKRKTAWGVTVGYRHVTGQPTQSGVEIGLPLLVGGLRGDELELAAHLEPVYGFSAGGVGWSYRARTDWHLPRTRLFPSVSFEQKAVRDGPDVTILVLQVGIRL